MDCLPACGGAKGDQGFVSRQGGILAMTDEKQGVARSRMSVKYPGLPERRSRNALRSSVGSSLVTHSQVHRSGFERPDPALRPKGGRRFLLSASSGPRARRGAHHRLPAGRSLGEGLSPWWNVRIRLQAGSYSEALPRRDRRSRPTVGQCAPPRCRGPRPSGACDSRRPRRDSGTNRQSSPTGRRYP